jgi:opacity protein-like surface antigen
MVKLLRVTSVFMAAAAITVAAGQTIAADASDIEEPFLGSFYVRGDAGWSFLDWEEGSDEGLTAGLGIGYQWSEFLRTDARADWSGPYEDSAVDLETTTLTGNAYIDIPLTTTITPYVGAGVGWGWVDGDGGDDSGLAYSFMVGSGFALTDNVELDAGYRYRGISIDGEDPTDHSITGGIRFKF